MCWGCVCHCAPWQSYLLIFKVLRSGSSILLYSYLGTEAQAQGHTLSPKAVKLSSRKLPPQWGLSHYRLPQPREEAELCAPVVTLYDADSLDKLLLCSLLAAIKVSTITVAH